MHLYPKRAVLQGAGAEVFKLMSYGATPDQWAEWLRAPLEHAAARGNLALVLTLLEAGANGGAGWRGCRGRTLLDAAALGGNADVVSALLRAGCGPDVGVVCVSSRRSALHVAAVCGHEAVARELLAAGADANRVDPGDQCCPLHVAARGGHRRLAWNLLSAGAFPHAPDSDGLDALHVAAKLGHAKVVFSLLGSSVDKNAADGYGWTPLMKAARNDRLDTVKTLLAAGADAGKCGERTIYVSCGCCLDKPFPPLGLAARWGHLDVVQAFIGHGLDVNAVLDPDDQTALHLAVDSNRADVIDALVDAGADLEAQTSFNQMTPLHYAAKNLKFHALIAIVRRGANINAQTRNGNTPLHYAVSFTMPAIEPVAEFLLRWGACTTTADCNGETPADLVATFNYRRTMSRMCPQFEVMRVRKMLAQGPMNGAWRRRCWLIMLRARVTKERVGGLGGGGWGNVRWTDFYGARGGPMDLNGQRAVGNLGVEKDGWWSTTVGTVVALESEGVFRKIVEYL